MIEIQKKLDELKSILKSMNKVSIAFSGGVDSMLLLKVAAETLGKENVLALTIDVPYMPRWEIEEAKELAEELGVKHKILKKEIDESIRYNPEDRCYICKKLIFSNLLEFSETKGFVLTEGTNSDDLNDYRPGLKALKELNVRSPLLEANLTKEEIRSLSKEYVLKTWNKPSYACLISRIEYGATLDEDILRMIEKGELFLREKGFLGARLRVHKNLCRIEVYKNQIEEVLKYREEIIAYIKELGFSHVTLDLEGYITGSMNVNIGGSTNG